MVESSPLPLPIVAVFVTELMASTQIKAAVEKQGFEVRFVDGGIVPEINESAVVVGEPTQGPEVKVFEQLTRWSPILIIMDIGEVSLPWQYWLKRIKTSPSTRRFPMVCYGPHVQTDLLAEAKSLGADVILSRSRFFSDLPNILQKNALVQDKNLLDEYCQRPLTEPALSGVNAFNDGEYFDAHEFLEEAWKTDQTAGRDFYRALIQIAVAYLQITRGNYRGAFKMLLRSRQWIRDLPDSCQGVDIKSLRVNSLKVYNELMRLGEEAIGEFDLSLLQPLGLIDQ